MTPKMAAFMLGISCNVQFTIGSFIIILFFEKKENYYKI